MYGFYTMTRIVFSKDRALQLHAFLRSFQDHVSPHARMTVLYRATTPRHDAAYVQLFRAFPWVQGYRQSESFKTDLLTLVPATGSVICYADDHLFVRPWVEEDAPINLHLGLNLRHCYTLNVAQPVPTHTLIEPDKMTWRWGAGICDWGYPLAVCGQVFDAAEFRPMLSILPFTSPNTLESALQVFAPAFMDRKGICYRESKLVLLPWNLVQTDCSNRVAKNLPSVDELLTSWEAGYQVDVSPLYGVLNSSLHQELPLVLERR